MSPALLSSHAMSGRSLFSIDALAPVRAANGAAQNAEKGKASASGSGAGAGAGASFSDDPFTRMLEQNRQAARLDDRRQAERVADPAARSQSDTAKSAAPAAPPASGAAPAAQRPDADHAEPENPAADTYAPDGRNGVARNLMLKRAAAAAADQRAAQAGVPAVPPEKAKAAEGDAAAAAGGSPNSAVDSAVPEASAKVRPTLIVPPVECPAAPPEPMPLEQLSGVRRSLQASEGAGDGAGDGVSASASANASASGRPERGDRREGCFAEPGDSSASSETKAESASPAAAAAAVAEPGSDTSAATAAAGTSLAASPAPAGSAANGSTATTSGAGAGSAGAQAQLGAHPDSPAFGMQLSAQVSLWLRQGVHEARLQLNPAELGPVQLAISLDGSAAQVSFAAEQATTRQALELALPTLACTLSEAGFTLSGGGVFDQAQQGADTNDRDPTSRSAAIQTNANGAEQLPGANMQPLQPLRPRGMVDLVA